MNIDVADIFFRLKYPEQHANLIRGLEAIVQRTGVDGIKADERRRRAKIAELGRLDNPPHEALLGISAEELVNFQESRAARRRTSGNNRLESAMKVVASAFLESENAGCTASEALDKAEEAIAESFTSGREANVDRKTLAVWLRKIQARNLTTIPKAQRGRPKKE
ncbi:hypothetical protein [Marinobacter sp. F4206]|uniref:hypothetical protein n=1 Tax=Marinobacter sp. F4206 TaxID=2861777 RepID=UPI001C603BF9|nr:hypothetical protein [Marinobacter sp. F4206]MBW4933272.1 hypothetical protein [Marinobacter sp. F4206]